MYLERLKKYGPKLNCVVTLTEELALAQAAQADKEIRAGKYRGPLHGIPWGAKDLFATKGILTTWGAGPFQNQVFDYDATIVERLARRRRGARRQAVDGRARAGRPLVPRSDQESVEPRERLERLVGGTRIGDGRRPRRLLDRHRDARLDHLAVGGQRRHGLRPTYGRVSRHGAMALSWTMDKIGPMCRSVEDCALVFNAIYGPDGRDDTVVDAPFMWNPDVPLSKLKIGYIKAEFEAPPAPDAAPW